MKTRMLSFVFGVLVVALVLAPSGLVAGPTTEPSEKSDSLSAGFDTVRSLAGTWESVGVVPMFGKSATLIFKST